MRGSEGLIEGFTALIVLTIIEEGKDIEQSDKITAYFYRGNAYLDLTPIMGNKGKIKIENIITKIEEDEGLRLTGYLNPSNAIGPYNRTDEEEQTIARIILALGNGVGLTVSAATDVLSVMLNAISLPESPCRRGRGQAW